MSILNVKMLRGNLRVTVRGTLTGISMALSWELKGGIQVLQIQIRAYLPFLEFNNEVAPNIYQNIEKNLRRINAQPMECGTGEPFLSILNHGEPLCEEFIKITKEITNFMGKCI